MRSLESARHALRAFRRSPGFTLTAVLTLAIGVGANTAVLSVVHAVLLRPLPYAEPDRLLSIADARQSRSTGGVMAGNLADYRRARSLAGVAGYGRTSMSLTGAGTPEQVLGEEVTWNLLSVTGTPPATGRDFVESDSRPGAGRVVLLAHAFWQRRFVADPSVVGRTLVFNDAPYVVIGVLPEGFLPLSQPRSGFVIDFLVPIAESAAFLASRARRQLDAVGRLAPGVSIDQAAAELRTIAAGAARRFPETNRDLTAAVEPLRDYVVRDEVRQSLVVLLAAVGLVLVIACVNLGGLLLARAVDQQREIATRLALGATRGHIAADFAVRGMMLGVLGGAVGLGGGAWIRDVLVALAPPGAPGLDRLGLDPQVIGVTAALSLLAGIAAGLLPAAPLWRHEPGAAAGGIGRTMSATRSAARWRGALMSAEVAAALVLLIGAGLLGRSLLRLTAVEIGFDSGRVLMFTLRLPESRYPDAAARLRFFDEVEQRLAALPGVRAVGAADALPLRGGWRATIVPAAADDRGLAAEGRADIQLITPGYFPVLRIAAVRGRLFGRDDRGGAEPAAVVSEAFVRRFLGPGDPMDGDSAPPRRRTTSPSSGSSPTCAATAITRRSRRRCTCRRRSRSGIRGGWPRSRCSAMPIRSALLAMCSARSGRSIAISRSRTCSRSTSWWRARWGSGASP